MRCCREVKEATRNKSKKNKLKLKIRSLHNISSVHTVSISLAASVDLFLVLMSCTGLLQIWNVANVLPGRAIFGICRSRKSVLIQSVPMVQYFSKLDERNRGLTFLTRSHSGEGIRGRILRLHGRFLRRDTIVGAQRPRCGTQCEAEAAGSECNQHGERTTCPALIDGRRTATHKKVLCGRSWTTGAWCGHGHGMAPKIRIHCKAHHDVTMPTSQRHCSSKFTFKNLTLFLLCIINK